MAPSKEAMEAAEKIVTVEKAVLGGYYVALCGTVVGISFPDAELATSGTKWYREQVATALDDHTADLRAEVEALRARVPVWNDASKKPAEEGLHLVRTKQRGVCLFKWDGKHWMEQIYVMDWHVVEWRSID